MYLHVLSNIFMYCYVFSFVFCIQNNNYCKQKHVKCKLSNKYTLLNKAKWILYDEKLERELDNSSDKIIANNKVKRLVIYNSNFNICSLKEGQEMISSVKDYMESNKVIVLEK